VLFTHLGKGGAEERNPKNRGERRSFPRNRLDERKVLEQADQGGGESVGRTSGRLGKREYGGRRRASLDPEFPLTTN